MRVILGILGLLAALVMIVVSGAMNFVFMLGQGKTALEGQMLGGASAAADCLKALIPFFMHWALDSKPRKWGVVIGGSLLFVVFTAFSLMSALGFAADNRHGNAGKREVVSADYVDVEQDLKRLEAAVKALPPARPVTVVQEEIEQLKQDMLWARSKNCADATVKTSREFCAGYFKIRGELATARERDRLAGQMSGLKAKGSQLREKGAGQDADPQVSILASLLHMEAGFVRSGLIVFVALLVELGSGFGLFLATAHWTRRKAAPKAESLREGDGATVLEAVSTGGAGEGGSSVELEAPERIEASEDYRTLAGRRRPRALPAPTARKVGDIEDFCLERIRPDEGAVAEADLFADYETWCRMNGTAAMRLGDFERVMRRIAKRVGIKRKGRVYRGIGIGGVPPATVRGVVEAAG